MLQRTDRAARRAKVREAVARHRERQKNCQAMYRVVVDGRVLNMLVTRGYVLDHETCDANEVSQAIALFLSDHAELDQP
jgi:hypothetical protein